MKIALCIHGLYRAHVRPDPKNLIQMMKSAFPTADVYYHTWTERINDVPEQYRDQLFSCNQPRLNYHPIIDTPDINKHGKFINYKQKNLMNAKQGNASLQILAYADLYRKIPKQYDVYIRARWDTLISTKVDFQPFLEEALDHPVGFMHRHRRGVPFDKPAPVDRENINDDWYGYLCDSMIMHPPKHFDPDYVDKLNREKRLWSAEWGWYQVMSEPYGDVHNCYHGGADLAR